MDGITAKEDALFNEWRSRRDELVVPDGVVSPEHFHETAPRILFVLKEVNDIHSQDWDLRRFLRQGGRSQSWNNISRWVEALNDGGAKRPWTDVRQMNNDLRMERLRSIAALNVKKTSGGGSSDRKEIERFAAKDADLLRRQFALYEPDFTVFCGTDPEWIPQFAAVEGRRTRRGIEYRQYRDGGYGISFWHPQARYPAKLMYYALADAAAELHRSA